MREGHAPDTLPANVELPTYVDDADVGDSLEGIPYCWGGSNGLDDVARDSFETSIAKTSGGIASRITGNVDTDAGGHQSGTIGLDCSGFVSSAYNFYTRCDTINLPYRGHEIDVSEVDDIRELTAALQPMDLIVSEDYHCMLYLGPSEDYPETCIRVYECTSQDDRERVQDQNTAIRNISWTELREDRYVYRRMTCVYGSNATTHWYMCAYCDYTNGVAEHDWEVPDVTKPNEKYCKICKYCPQHAFTYFAVSATSHTRTCTVCGYSDTVDHTFTYTSISGTQHTKTCTGCGYSVTESHGGPCVAISPTQHVKPCMACGYSVTENHDMNETYNLTMHAHYCGECGYSVSASHDMETEYDSTSHWDQCTGCDYTNMNEAHTFTYTTYNLVKHRQTCSTCGYSALAPHLLGYSYDADGHWQECSLCSFETVSFAHNFVDSECTVCGCPEFIIMDIIAIPEEDEPLPVPEDQKATL